MRLARIIAVCTTAVLLAAGCQHDPVKPPNPPTPRPTQLVAQSLLNSELVEVLKVVAPFRQTEQREPDKQMSIEEVQRRLNKSWKAYLGQLPRTAPLTNMEIFPGVTAPAGWCEDIRQPPSYCRVTQRAPSFGEISGILLLQDDAEQKVRASGGDNKSAWVLAALLVGFFYADHLQAQLSLFDTTWKDHPDQFNRDVARFCVAGIGLRAFFSLTFPGKLLSTYVESLQRLAGQPTAQYPELVTALDEGYLTGQLDKCAAPSGV